MGLLSHGSLSWPFGGHSGPGHNGGHAVDSVDHLINGHHRRPLWCGRVGAGTLLIISYPEHTCGAVLNSTALLLKDGS